jgi:hypothetical protein
MSKSKKALVVDASIAFSSGTTTHPTSTHCREFLIAFQEQTLRVVMSPDIYVEWKKHASSFSHKWLAQMTGRKRVIYVRDVEDTLLREKICTTSDRKKDQNVMEKDCRLLEAALKTDNLVASLDETVRSLFRHAAQTVREIRSIVWVNPDKEDEMVIDWLKAGAPSDKKRQLGYDGK